MLLVITYDVNTKSMAGEKRLRKVAKICERYGIRVQNSVFEVLVSAAEATELKAELRKAIDIDKDSIRFYKLGNSYERKIEKMGKQSPVQTGEALMF